MAIFSIFDKNEIFLRKSKKTVEKINQLENEYEKLSESQLRSKTE